jgi:hypothetical protein
MQQGFSERGPAVARRVGKPVPQELRTLVEQCWEPQADKRPGFKAIAARLQALFDALPPCKKDKKCSLM